MHYSCSRFGRGIPGEPRVIVVAADINNTALQGACFNGGVEDGEGPKQEKGWGGAVRGK